MRDKVLCRGRAGPNAANKREISIFEKLFFVLMRFCLSFTRKCSPDLYPWRCKDVVG